MSEAATPSADTIVNRLSRSLQFGNLNITNRDFEYLYQLLTMLICTDEPYTESIHNLLNGMLPASGITLRKHAKFNTYRAMVQIMAIIRLLDADVNKLEDFIYNNRYLDINKLKDRLKAFAAVEGQPWIGDDFNTLQNYETFTKKELEALQRVITFIDDHKNKNGIKVFKDSLETIRKKLNPASSERNVSLPARDEVIETIKKILEKLESIIEASDTNSEFSKSIRELILAVRTLSPNQYNISMAEKLRAMGSNYKVENYGSRGSVNNRPPEEITGFGHLPSSSRAQEETVFGFGPSIEKPKSRKSTNIPPLGTVERIANRFGGKQNIKSFEGKQIDIRYNKYPHTKKNKKSK